MLRVLGSDLKQVEDEGNICVAEACEEARKRLLGIKVQIWVHVKVSLCEALR